MKAKRKAARTRKRTGASKVRRRPQKPERPLVRQGRAPDGDSEDERVWLDW
jgi:hypothetical protein